MFRLFRPRQHAFAYLFERFPSFVQTFCYREVQQMAEQGMNPLILSVRPPDDPAAAAVLCTLPVTYLPPEKELRAEIDRQLAARTLPWRVRRALKRHRQEPDSQRLFEAAWIGPRLKEQGIRHVHAHFGGLATRTAWWLRNLYGLTYSYTGHANDIFCEHDTPLTNAQLARHARLIVTETDYARRWMEEHHPTACGKVVRVFNGITVPAAPSRFVPADRPPRLYSVGRYVEKKGFGDLIQSCRLLRDAGVAFECHIAGGGPLHQQLQAQIDEAGLHPQVQLLGPLPQGVVSAQLRDATLFVLPCVPEAGGGSDNLPTVVIEAMAAGVPVICTPVAGVPEMITSERDGLLVPPSSPTLLSAAIQRLLADPSLAARLGHQGWETARAKFQLPTTVAELKNHLLHRCPVSLPRRTSSPSPK